MLAIALLLDAAEFEKIHVSPQAEDSQIPGNSFEDNAVDNVSEKRVYKYTFKNKLHLIFNVSVTNCISLFVQSSRLKVTRLAVSYKL